MHKRGRKLAVILLLLFFVVIIWYLQRGKEMDVYNTFSTSSANFYEETIIVTANRLFIFDKEKCAEEIFRKCRENSFHSVRFSYDVSKLNALSGTVYRFRFGRKWSKPAFSFRYTQKTDKLGTKNIVDNPENFMLEIY